MRLLVVEDDHTIAEPLVTGLRREGFEVDLAVTGAAALEADPADLVLLDLGLPDLDGRVVCQELRKRSTVPIIVVTARGDEIDRVMLLELGADDYVVKPFGFRELVARIRAVMRRIDAPAATPPDHVTGFDGLTIDRRTRRVSLDGSEVALTPKEYDLVVELASDPGAIFTREYLIENVWDKNWWGSTKTLDVHIASIRKKLDPELIETVRGVGFRLAARQGDS
ncbi:MAG: response regulator transcription factor [Acidimicrobiales bacterium]|nr:response regulator transcription factor [Acidimicrobiales bacterium]